MIIRNINDKEEEEMGRYEPVFQLIVIIKTVSHQFSYKIQASYLSVV